MPTLFQSLLPRLIPSVKVWDFVLFGLQNETNVPQLLNEAVYIRQEGIDVLVVLRGLMPENMGLAKTLVRIREWTVSKAARSGCGQTHTFRPAPALWLLPSVADSGLSFQTFLAVRRGPILAKIKRRAIERSS
jgi:hypothetical protein